MWDYSIFFEYKSVMWSSPNDTPIKYMFPIKKGDELAHAYFNL